MLFTRRTSGSCMSWRISDLVACARCLSSSFLMQVVAGKNYKLVIDLATKEQKVQPYEATVYGNLNSGKHTEICRGLDLRTIN